MRFGVYRQNHEMLMVDIQTPVEAMRIGHLDYYLKIAFSQITPSKGQPVFLVYFVFWVTDSFRIKRLLFLVKLKKSREGQSEGLPRRPLLK